MSEDTNIKSNNKQSGFKVAIKNFLDATEIDPRMLGMIIALLAIWLVFDFFSGGRFITPRNLWNLGVQSSSVAVMATGMVFIIVTRNIDLSIGSMLGVIGMLMGILQAEILPDLVGYGHWSIWIVTLTAGIMIGVTIGAFQGSLVAYLGVPAFIVTLGGLLVWRGAAWWTTSGRTVAPLDDNFRLMGGGINGSIGYWPSWIVGIIACVAILYSIVNARRQRKRFHFPLRPLWAETLLAFLWSGMVLGAVAVANNYYLPSRVAAKIAEEKGLTIPEEGLFISYGLPIPLLIAIGVVIVMHFIATRTRFGRYIFAFGGNPEAAELSGINTKKLTIMIFAIIGGLAAIGAAITTARLNAATNSLGILDELLVIAAAVIGGSSLSGGIGTIAGALLGALVMQSLQSGMILVGMDSPMQNIVVGIVLVFAVFIDTLYRKHAG
ncbi:MAG: sugar ABC transporter permease [Cocleimonas sp.]|nr:sugar ABC transporter permease [Cocleimonas sp.]